MVRKGFSLSSIVGREHSRGVRFALLGLGGALTALTVAVPQLGMAQWITLIPAALAIIGLMSSDTIRLRTAYGYGLYFFMCYYCVIYHWFVTLYPLEFTGMGPGAAVVVVLAGWFGLSLLQALCGGLVFVALVALGKTRAVKSIPLLTPLLAGGLWGIFEWSQTFFWTGVPWGRLAIGQTECLVMLRSSAFFGSYFVTFMIVAVNFTAALALVGGKRRGFYATCAGGLIVAQLLLGVCSTLVYLPTDENGFRVAAIQGNIASSEKWDMSPEQILDVYEQLSMDAAAAGAELIVWPETAVPITLEGNPNRVARIKRLAVSCEADILVGMFTTDDSGADQNAIVLFDRDGGISEQVYIKRRLVPFGEFVPMRGIIEKLIPPLTELGMLGDDLVAGEDSGLIEWQGIQLGSLICFDSIYESETLESVRDGAEILILPTNDSWFFDSAAVYMHNAQAKMRAVESGRWLVRAANTGVSSIITPQGETVQLLDALETGFITDTVFPVDETTLYTVIGNLWIYLMMAFILATALSEPITRRMSKKITKKH